MSHIYYKFQSSNDHDIVKFDGLSISLTELKSLILAKSKVAGSTDFSLQITNAQTKEVYKNDSDLIPKNTSVTVTRVPVPKVYKGEEDVENMDEDSHLAFLAKRADKSISLAEEQSIRSMMTESTSDYAVENYTVRPNVVPRGSSFGTPHAGYICKRCQKPGHYIQNCPSQINSAYRMPAARLPKGPTIRHGHGIPMDFLVPALPDAPGAVWTKYGFATTKKDVEAYEDAARKKSNQAKPDLPEFEIPSNFICPICNEIMTDAVKTSCCATHFCDSCVRTALLEDEDKSCPHCGELEYPDSLQPDILLRNAITTFLNKTKNGFRIVQKSKKPSPASTSASVTAAESSATTSTQSTPPTVTNSSAATTSTASEAAATAAPLSSPASQGSTETSTIVTESSVSTPASAVASTTSTALPSAATVTTAISAEAAPGTVPVTQMAVAPALAPAAVIATSSIVSSTVAQPMTASGYVANSAPYNPPPTYPQPMYRPAVPAPYATFPPGMRPGFVPPFVQTPAVYNAVNPYPMMTPTGQPILTKEEFYKTKAELLEQRIKESEVSKKPKDKVMDAFEDVFQARPRARSRSRSPRSRSPRPRSRGRRSYSRSPGRRRSYSRSPRRRRSISPRPYYRRRSRTPPMHREYRRGDNYYGSRSDEYYRRERDDRYVEKYFYNGYSDRLSPYQRHVDGRGAVYTPPLRGVTPDYPSPHSYPYSPRRKDDKHADYYEDKDRRRYNDEGYKYNGERRYGDAEYEYSRRRRRDGEYSRNGYKYDDKYEEDSKTSRKRKERHDEASGEEQEKKPASNKDSRSRSKEKVKVGSASRSKKQRRQSVSPSDSSSGSEDEKSADSEPETREVKQTKVKKDKVVKCAAQSSDVSDTETKAKPKKSSSKTKAGHSKSKTKSAKSKKSADTKSTSQDVSDDKSAKSTDKKQKKKKNASAVKTEDPKEKLMPLVAGENAAESKSSTAAAAIKPEASVSTSSQVTTASSQDSDSSIRFADLTGEEDENSALPAKDLDIQIIPAPQTSKWDNDDSESDNKVSIPRTSKSDGHGQSKSVSKKVLACADSVIRNKKVQPMSGPAKKRSVHLPDKNADSEKRVQLNDSDDSDGKSDLREKLKRIKNRKSSISSDREKNPDHSLGKLRSDATEKPYASSRSSDRHDGGKERSKLKDGERGKASRESSKISRESQYKKSSGENKKERSESRKSNRDRDVVSPSSKRAKYNSEGSSSAPTFDRLSDNKDVADKESNDIKPPNKGAKVTKTAPRNALTSQISEEPFEPDYDIELGESNRSAENSDHHVSTQSDEDCASNSESEDDSEVKKSKKHKRRSSSSKHKKHKKHSKKSKHKKHKSDRK